MRYHRILRRVFALCLCAALCTPALAAGQSFSDVPAGQWYHRWVTEAAGRGWVSGVGGGKYEPGKSVTYSQFAVMLGKAIYPDDLAAQPAGEQWWMAGCEAAAKHELFPDTDMAVRGNWPAVANTPIEREQMAQMVYNALAGQGIKLPSYEECSEAAKEIADIADVDNYAAVTACYTIGLLNGNDSGNFAPRDPMTRAQACVVLCNIYSCITGDVVGSVNPDKPAVTERPAGAVGGQYDVSAHDVPADANKDGWITESEVQTVLDQLKEEYPNRSTYDPTIFWNSPVMGYGKECAYIAFMFSDRIFGNLPKYTVSLENMRIGDVLKEPGHWSMTQNNYGDLSEQYRSINGGAKGVVSWTMLSRYDEWPASGVIYSRYPK